MSQIGKELSSRLVELSWAVATAGDLVSKGMYLTLWLE